MTVISLEPIARDARCRSLLGRLRFGGVARVNPPEHVWYEFKGGHYDGAATQGLKDYVYEVARGEFCTMTSFEGFTTLDGVFHALIGRPQDLPPFLKYDVRPHVIKEWNSAERNPYRMGIDFEATVQGAEMDVAMYVVNYDASGFHGLYYDRVRTEWHIYNETHKAFTKAVTAWIEWTGMRVVEPHRAMHHLMVAEFAATKEAMSVEFTDAMDGVNYSAYIEEFASLGFKLTPYRHQVEAVRRMLRMERPRELSGVRLTPECLYDPATGAMIRAEAAVKGGMCCLDVGLGKTMICVMLAAARLNRLTLQERMTYRDGLDLQGTVVIVPAHLLEQWGREIVVYQPAAKVARWNAADRAAADFVLVSRTDVKRLGAVKAFALVIDECHTLPPIPAQHEIDAHFRWNVSATPQRYQHDVKASFNNPLHAVGMRVLDMASCAKIPGSVSAWMRDHMLFLGQSAVADLLPAIVEETVVVPFDDDENTINIARSVAHEPRSQRDALFLQWRVAQGAYCLPKKDVVYKPPPKLNIDDLPTVYGDEPDDCPICLEPMEYDRVRTLCNHDFCLDCLIAGTAINGSCPMCRRPRVTKGLRRVTAGAASGSAAPPEPPKEPVPAVDEYVYTFTHKIRAAADLVAGNARKAIVFVDNLSCLMMTKAVFQQRGVGAVIVQKGPKVVDRLVDKFVRDDAVRCMILDMTRINDGLNLTVADLVVFINEPKSDAIKTQAIGRCARLGQVSEAVRVVKLA
jgi:SNF2-related domain/Ring finger domain